MELGLELSVIVGDEGDKVGLLEGLDEGTSVCRLVRLGCDVGATDEDGVGMVEGADEGVVVRLVALSVGVGVGAVVGIGVGDLLDVAVGSNPPPVGRNVGGLLGDRDEEEVGGKVGT